MKFIEKELQDLRYRHHEELHRLHHGFHQAHHLHHEEFRRLHRTMRFFSPVGIVFYLIVLYLLFHWGGFQVLGIIFALLFLAKEIVQIMIFRRLERGVFKPIEQLKEGFAEIAKGNYNITINPTVGNAFGQLIYSFNEMADKLRESERINSEYEENRKTLIVNISHDLKTPMTSIQGYIEIILEGGITQPDKLQRYLQTIYNNSTYMNKLIDDLFLFSKLDMDKMDFNYESLQVRPFMEDLMTEFKFELEEKNYGFSYQDKMEKDCLISIDGKRVYQAIRNIIGNAVKYGPENNLQVTVELYEQGDFACLDIQDNGPGIPEDKLPYIFERFYRIDTERSKDFMSTGLGLAITKELVEAQGGKISVSSSGDVGTCFTVCLPVKTPPESSLTL
jgi:signal transduction histidine kinase